jgi:CBS-domain-containing membrane protein
MLDLRQLPRIPYPYNSFNGCETKARRASITEVRTPAMMKTGEIYARNVATVGHDASVVRAAAIMRQHHLHNLVVVERKCGRWAPAGVITDRDIAIEVVGQGLDPRHVTVAAAMSSCRSDMCNVGSASDSAGTMAMDELLSLLVMELNHLGQPIRHNKLAQLSSLSAPVNPQS